MEKLQQLKRDACAIIDRVLRDAMPGQAVMRALENADFKDKRVVLIAAGKAAYSMAAAACRQLGSRIMTGIVITKYGHAGAPLPNVEIYEAGHPVADQNGFAATEKAIELAKSCGENDVVLFLLSGGGSALFESPLVSEEELADITAQMLGCAMPIQKINTIRKRLSKVKGGRFAQICAPAQVYSIVLSDIVGDPLDMIASGPCVADTSTCEQATRIVKEYGLKISDTVWQLLNRETPKQINNVQTLVTGSVSGLCSSAKAMCEQLGYEAFVLQEDMQCEAKEGAKILTEAARPFWQAGKKAAFIAGGETVVKLTGSGLGGRNQEFALSGAKLIDGWSSALLLSLGSDGTDGPTDAAGGMVHGGTCAQLKAQGIDIDEVLFQNDSYHALKAADSLIVTGPTGTNVNDVAVLLVDK